MWTEQWYLQFSPAPSKNGPRVLHGNLQWESYKLTCDRIDRVHSRLLINRSDSREDPIRFLLQRCGSNKVNLYVLFPVRLWRQNNILTSRFRPVEEAWCSRLLQCFYCPMLRRLVSAEFQEVQKEPMRMRYGISRRTNISIRMFCRQLWALAVWLLQSPYDAWPYYHE